MTAAVLKQFLLGSRCFDSRYPARIPTKTTSQGRRDQVGNCQYGCCVEGDCIITSTVTIANLMSISE